MPQRGGKKKKNQGRNRRDARQHNNSQPSATTNSAQGSARGPPTIGDPTNFESSQQKGKVQTDAYRTVYARYKAATKRVFEYLEANARKKDNLSPDEPITMHVNSLASTADWMAEACIPVDPDFLKDLRFSIRVRSKVARSVFGGGDAGHQYLLDTLLYCWKVLDSLPREVKGSVASENEEDMGNQHSSNPFEALQETGELEDEDMDDEIFSSNDIPRPELHSKPIPLEDILDSEEGVDARFFMITLNEFMRCVSTHYESVATYASWASIGDWIEKGMYEAVVIPALMRAAVISNMAIRQVERLETEFQLQHPHINTPYRLLSTFLFAPLIQDVVQVTRDYGRKACSVKEASLVLGDLLECSFREGTDPERRDDSEILSEFCSRFGIGRKEGLDALEMRVLEVKAFVRCELPIQNEDEVEGVPSHGVLPIECFKYIGGDRHILHTLLLLQWFGRFEKFVYDGDITSLEKGIFGSPWQPGKTTKIHNDLDDLLMTEILPNWCWLCRDWIKDNDQAMPQQDEIAPLWGCIRRFARSPEKPVKWSLVFAVHAMLTSILETDKIAVRLTSDSQKSFLSFFDQLEHACEHKKRMNGSFNSPVFNAGMPMLQYLKKLAVPLPMFGPCTLWNPLCGGTSLLYLNYVGNITSGTMLIDDRCQLKIALHLYHALIVNGVLQQEDIPFLDGLYEGFKKSRTLWGGSLPEKGKSVEHFWLCMHNRLMNCPKDMVTISRLDDRQASPEWHLGVIKTLCGNEPPALMGRRSIREIFPAQFLTSFHLCCTTDYRDVVDWYCQHSKQKRGSQFSDIYEYIVQTNDIVNVMKKEQSFVGYNLAACGVYLDEFVCGMSRYFEWDKLFKKGNLQVQKTKRERPERIGEEYMFAYHVLGKLDQAKGPSELGNFKDFVANFMIPFFKKLSKEKLCSWIPETKADGPWNESLKMEQQCKKQNSK